MPHRQNQVIKLVNHEYARASQATLREYLGLLDRYETSDPYLEGRWRLARARVLRQFGRQEESLAEYERAIHCRLPFEFRVELALYLLELSRQEAALEQLKLVESFNFHFKRAIDDPRLRRQVLDLLKEDPELAH